MKSYFFLVAVITLGACGGEKEQKQTAESAQKIVNVPAFNVDSAYYFVQKQVNFGPRVPNTPSHQKAGDYFVTQLKKYGGTVIEQNFSATTFDNHRLALRNIIASFNPKNKKRILLASHWDTRPFADKDPVKLNDPFDGANDGASGVGVLLEIARTISTDTSLAIGVDLILFDGEDWGDDGGAWGRKYNESAPFPNGYQEWYCLGSQYWARNKHAANYSAYFGILLDMVGGKNTVFAREGYSMEYAPSVVDKVWKTASQLGFSHIFINQRNGGITDDHKFVNEVGKIPMIDIISFDMETGFGDFHHTRKDNMEIISKETLGAVGTTLLHVVYYE